MIMAQSPGDNNNLLARRRGWDEDRPRAIAALAESIQSMQTALDAARWQLLQLQSDAAARQEPEDITNTTVGVAPRRLDQCEHAVDESEIAPEADEEESEEFLYDSVDSAIAAISRRGLECNDFRGLVKYGRYNGARVYLRCTYAKSRQGHGNCRFRVVIQTCSHVLGKWRVLAPVHEHSGHPSAAFVAEQNEGGSASIIPMEIRHVVTHILEEYGKGSRQELWRRINAVLLRAPALVGSENVTEYSSIRFVYSRHVQIETLCPTFIYEIASKAPRNFSVHSILSTVLHASCCRFIQRLDK
eukprot:m.221965 g.221965  ORF g.221965 m.221965 type:complete len:301 (-) comp19193_c0_seq12:4101-5003(-)